MNKPLILIPLFNVEPNELSSFRRYSVNEPFLKICAQLEILPLCVPICLPEEQLAYFAQLADGLLLQGGHDIHPQFFSDDELHERSYCSPPRDEAEIFLIKKFKETKKPILGICRGLQILNVAYGGTLYRDQPSEYPTETKHFPHDDLDVSDFRATDLEEAAHTISVQSHSELFNIMQKDVLHVNSLHHQAIRDVSNDLIVSAVAEDGIVEACESRDMEDHWVLGVQWHPEFYPSIGDHHKEIFRAFLAAVKKQG